MRLLKQLTHYKSVICAKGSSFQSVIIRQLRKLNFKHQKSAHSGRKLQSPEESYKVEFQKA